MVEQPAEGSVLTTFGRQQSKRLRYCPTGHSIFFKLAKNIWCYLPTGRIWVQKLRGGCGCNPSHYHI